MKKVIIKTDTSIDRWNLKNNVELRKQMSEDILQQFGEETKVIFLPYGWFSETLPE